MEAETCSKNAIIPVCIPVNGMSEQHLVPLEDTCSAKAWKASGKAGHSFGAGKKPETPHGSYCSKAGGLPVLRGSAAC